LGNRSKTKNFPKFTDIPEGNDSNPDIIGIEESGNYNRK